MHITPNTSSSLFLIKSKTLVILQPKRPPKVACLKTNQSLCMGTTINLNFPQNQILNKQRFPRITLFSFNGWPPTKICRTISPARNTQELSLEQLTVFSQASVANLLEVCLYHRTSCEEVPIGSVFKKKGFQKRMGKISHIVNKWT